MSRVAVVLMNLGGPDSLDAVEPFLRNLFRDPAIIRAPGPVRWLLAQSDRKAPRAGSTGDLPLDRRTFAIARRDRSAGGGVAGCSRRSRRGRGGYCDALLAPDERGGGTAGGGLPARSDRAAASLPAVLDHDRGLVARRLAERRQTLAGIAAPTRAVCCYPRADGLIAAQAALIEPLLAVAAEAGKPRSALLRPRSAQACGRAR